MPDYAPRIAACRGRGANTRLRTRRAVRTYLEGKRVWRASGKSTAASAQAKSALALVDGLFEALGISAVVVGTVDATLAEALQHFAGARQLGAGNLGLLAPEA